MQHRTGVLNVLIYFLLVTGAAVFSFPFLWMASTSVKVDREMETRELTIMPIAPIPSATSPYVDERHYASVKGPHLGELLPLLRDLARKSGFEIPPEVDRDIAVRNIALGLYDSLLRRLPKEVWEGRRRLPDESWSEPADPVAALTVAARAEIDREAVSKVFDRIHRRLLLGAIRLRTYDRKECTLTPTTPGGAAAGASARLANLTPGTATLEDVLEQGQQFTLVRYNFAEGERVVLSGTFTVPDEVDLSGLHMIRMPVQPDDTWHQLSLTVEMSDATYRSARPVPTANYDVATLSWQPPGPDDTSTKIKSWIRLNKVERSGGETPARNQIRLTLELRKVSRAGAWLSKVRRNYDLVFDHIPFWRYLRVSLFLVLANIVLTLASSSLVAYAFARLNWPGRNLCFALMLATMMIPSQVVMIPQFLIWKNLGAYNTLTPLWLGPAFGNAFFIFLLRQFMKGIPRDLEDAARIDGCGFLRIYYYIILPLIKPSLAAIAIFTFMGTWNNFMGPLLYIADQRLYPLAFGLYAFSVQVGNNPALTMAGGLLMTVPVIVIFFFAQKYFIQGITLTGIKQ